MLLEMKLKKFQFGDLLEIVMILFILIEKIKIIKDKL